MSIVLNEHEWAQQMIDEKSLGKKPSETLKRVARYYLDQGYSVKEVRPKLDAFMLSCDPSTSIPKWEDTLQASVDYAVKHPAIMIESIDACASELATIDALQTATTKRLAFTLLCLSKYCYQVNPKSNHWVTVPDNEIMVMADIHTSVTRQSAMYRALWEKGLIQFSKQVDNTNVRVLFADDGEPVVKITDLRNLGYRYLMICGQPYFECKNCGIVTKYKSTLSKRSQKYCPECAAKMKVKQNVEAMARFKSKRKKGV